MDAKLKALEVIRGMNNRLATDSFQPKGWAVVLVATGLALAGAGRAHRACHGHVNPGRRVWRRDGGPASFLARSALCT